MTEKEISQPIPPAERQDIEKDKILLASIIIALAFTLFSGIFVGLGSGFITYYYATHGKTLPKSEIYGILTGICGSIIVFTIVIITLLL